MAYVLGFIYADGNIMHTKRDTWFFSIQITDKDILEKMKLVMDSSHIISRKKKVENHKQLYRIQIGSKEMCGDLLNLGLTARKSKKIIFPEVSEKYFPDFLRGYFDGDGGVWIGSKNKCKGDLSYIISVSFTSGSEVFLVSLKKILSNWGLAGGSLVKKGRGFDLKYSVKDSLILYKIMYNGMSQGLFLKRKKDKFDEYMRLRS